MKVFNELTPKEQVNILKAEKAVGVKARPSDSVLAFASKYRRLFAAEEIRRRTGDVVGFPLALTFEFEVFVLSSDGYKFIDWSMTAEGREWRDADILAWRGQ